jgi:hypothetical protein
MQLPFSRAEFFDLFAAYNGTLWPAIAALWVVSFATMVRLAVSPRSHDRWISGLLAVHWAWCAIAYHVSFFTRINPAAWLFAALFLLQALLFLRSAVVEDRLSFASSGTAWASVAWFLAVYALVYPALNAIEHGSVLKIPTFGLPCPTTILTAGLLLLARRRSRALTIVPIIWSAIGGSAAFLFGVSADYALPVAGAALVFDRFTSTFRPAGSRRHRQGAPQESARRARLPLPCCRPHIPSTRPRLPAGTSRC